MPPIADETDMRCEPPSGESAPHREGETRSLTSRLRDTGEAGRKRRLYEERLQRARGSRTTKSLLEDMLREIDGPDAADQTSEDDAAGDDAAGDDAAEAIDDRQGEGVFVRDRDVWVSIDERRPRRTRIVFRLKWKR